MDVWGRAINGLNSMINGNNNNSQNPSMMPHRPVSRVYLVGQMTGQSHNEYRLFFEVAETLRQQGYTVLNEPGYTNYNMDGAWQANMRKEIATLMSKEPDAVVLIDNGSNSRGVKLIQAICAEVLIPVIMLNQLRAM